MNFNSWFYYSLLGQKVQKSIFVENEVFPFRIGENEQNIQDVGAITIKTTLKQTCNRLTYDVVLNAEDSVISASFLMYMSPKDSHTLQHHVTQTIFVGFFEKIFRGHKMRPAEYVYHGTFSSECCNKLETVHSVNLAGISSSVNCHIVASLLIQLTAHRSSLIIIYHRKSVFFLGDLWGTVPPTSPVSRDKWQGKHIGA